MSEQISNNLEEISLIIIKYHTLATPILICLHQVLNPGPRPPKAKKLATVLYQDNKLEQYSLHSGFELRSAYVIEIL